MKKIYLILILFLMFSCGKNVKKYPYSEEIYTKDNKKVIVTYLNDSISKVTTYFKNGNISEFEYLDRRTNNKKGEYISYYSNGRIKEKGNYTNNVADGIWYCYSETGCLKEKREDIYYNGNRLVNLYIHYNEDMSIDTTKLNVYFTIVAFQDTIYKGEPYLLNIKLNVPKFKDGMYIMLLKDKKQYCELFETFDFKESYKDGDLDQIVSITDYKVGNNNIHGAIINHNKDKKLIFPFYFTKSFYVKEIPR